ncbi:unnamed protein product [Auanema sp. JU1783]|nr:unnamed protein product [Auanema sp. JU1783]
MYRAMKNSSNNHLSPNVISLEKNVKVPKQEISDTTLKVQAQTNRLTERQREILKKTFHNMEGDCVKLGLKMLLRLFSEYPRYKLIWPQFRAIPDSSLMHANQLRRHSSVYMAGLRSIIHSMNKETELADQLMRIAKAHIKWNIHRSHIQHMLDPVLEVVKEANGYEMDDETKEAWTTLYDVIAELIEIYRAKA